MAAVGTIVLALVAVAQTEAAAPAASACPTVEAVWTNVAGLVGRERVASPEARPTVTVEDLGTGYRVTVAGRAHDYDDAARDCGRRAQVAAVFVGLTLWPLAMASAPPPPAPAPPLPAPAGLAVSLALAPWVGVAGASGAGLAHGLSLRAAVEGARLGVVVGVGADAPLHLTLMGVAVDERRYPFDVGLRLRVGGERVSLLVDAGVVATVVGVGARGGASTVSLDLGARAGATVEVRLSRTSRLAPAVFMGAFSEISPAPRRLAFEPDGPVGHASWARAGVTLGFSLRLR